MVENAQDKAQEVASQARDAASQAKEKAGSVVRRQVDERTSQTGIAIHSTAQDLRTVGQELRNQGKETPAKVAEQIADRGEQLAGYLRTNDANRILHDVEDFARRQPWAVIAGGLVLGFVASRFLKSSSERRYGSKSVAGGMPPRPMDASHLSHTSTRSTDEIRSSLESAGAPPSVATSPAL
jgi:ElaB/YqjD/DUF883 family membrane-anchored ribosome-binding protein